MEKFINHLKQPSTAKGIAFLSSALGLGIPLTLIDAICQGVVASLGVWAIVRDELKGAKKMVEKTK